MSRRPVHFGPPDPSDLESILVIKDDAIERSGHAGEDSSNNASSSKDSASSSSSSAENSFKRRAVSEDPSVLSNESGISSQIEYDEYDGLEEEEEEEEEAFENQDDDDDEESNDQHHERISLSSLEEEEKEKGEGAGAGGGIVNLGRIIALHL